MFSWSTVEVIIGIIATLSTGGVIGSLVGFRYIKSKEAAKARQETAQADSQELTNARNLIELYKNALDDVKVLNDKSESEYLKKIEEYDKKLEQYKSELDSYQKKHSNQERTIEELTRNQLRLKMEIQNLQIQSLESCDSCFCKATCEKYKAKKIAYNENNV